MGLCLYQAHWHQGVTGIVAARLKDRYARPTIAFAKVDEQDLKGSARSVAGLNIRDVTDRIATQNPGLITRFGGHAMAAGISLPEENYPSFCRAFEEDLSQHFSPKLIASTLYSDGELGDSLLTITAATCIRELGPYGQSFPEPLFDGVFTIIDQRLVGGKHLKLSLQTSTQRDVIDGIAFNIDVNTWPNYHAQRVHIAYRLDINEFQNRQRLQFIIDYLCIA